MDPRALHAWFRTAALLLILAAGQTGCASIASRPPVTTEQIVQMSREGVPAADIVQKMRDAGTVYRLSGSQLAQLKEQGVPDEVLDYMQETYLADAHARGAWYYGSYWGGPWPWGPYPYWGPYGYWGPYYPYYPYYPYRPYRPPPQGHPPSSPPPGATPPPGHPPPASPSYRQQRNGSSQRAPAPPDRQQRD
jgi:hypothetical protein